MRRRVRLSTHRERAMAAKKENAVYKVIEIVGTSSVSWADAAKNGVNAASKSLRDLRVAEVDKLDVKIESGKLIYRAKLKVSFKYHGDD
jgi:dodecin